MSLFHDSIFALTTPLAKSGVAVVRVSGSRALQALEILSGKTDWPPNLARYVTLRTPDGNIIDSGLAIFFQGPKSFTGENVVEFQVHGSLSVIRELLATLGKMEGLRHAEPGEFTRRAFTHGKLNLLESEGLADLIDAETAAQKAQALAQMQGKTSRYYEQLRAQVIECLAFLEAYIDFPEEDIPDSVLQKVKQAIDNTIQTIDLALADNHRGERLREGIRVVIIGAPNVGKSSLLNCLSSKEAAIVSPRAGTTRDAIEIHININGFPVILTDTAGLRDTTDDIEEEGVRRARNHAKNSDILLILRDATAMDAPLPEEAEQHADKSIIIANKCDLLPESEQRAGVIYVSAKTGQGMDTLINALEKRISTIFSGGLSSVITRARHRDLLLSARALLQRFSLDKPLELACEELRAAAQNIGRITGKIAVDDVLDVVFRRFCIGK